MAIGDKKKKLFNDAPVMPASPKRFTVVEAEGGFIVRSGEFDGKEKVAKSLAAVIKLLKSEFSSEEAEDESEDD